MTCLGAQSARQLENEGVPRKFNTRSRLVIIANAFEFGGHQETAAIIDRAQLFVFDPTPKEIHRQVGKWLRNGNREVYDFIGKRLNRMENLSARTYIRAAEQRAAGLDWRGMIEEQFCCGANEAVVLDLEADPSLRTRKDCRAAWSLR